MKKFHDSIRWFRSSIFGEYTLLLLVVVGLSGSFYLATQLVSDKAIVGERKSQSGDGYAEYAKTFQIYEGDFGFSFKYPPHLEIFEFGYGWVVLSVKDESQKNDSGKIVVSVAENDEQMTAEEWLLGPFSGYSQSKDDYGNYYKTQIDGQDAVYTDDGMWTIVNTPDNKYRLSIADLSPGNAIPLFFEMGIVVESLTFVSSEKKRI